MSTRKRTTAQDVRGQPLDTGTVDSANLPPTRPTKRISKGVKPPFSGVSLHSFIYALSLLACAYLAVQVYRIFSWKSQMGGWWNLAMGKSPAQVHAEQAKARFHDFSGARREEEGGGGGATAVEDKINELAAALGMPSPQLASAIAVAVREYVPPASLSSIAADAEETGGTLVVEELLGEEAGSKAKQADPLKQSTMGKVLGSVVGMDEPPTEMS